MKNIRLVAIGETGEPCEGVVLSPQAQEICRVSPTVYKPASVPPWVGYLTLEGPLTVGTCGFKTPPQNGRVEIAYHTFLGFEGRGYATAMARALVIMARKTDSSLKIFAQTLPKKNASNHLLQKMGFYYLGQLTSPEDGEVWEWELG